MSYLQQTSNPEQVPVDRQANMAYSVHGDIKEDLQSSVDQSMNDIHESDIATDGSNGVEPKQGGSNDVDDNDEQNNSKSSGNYGSKNAASYKYPALSHYYEFGPWISRNRRAICKGCQLSTSSSQPDRLLKHLRRCSGLSQNDRLIVEEIMLERNRSKVYRTAKKMQKEERSASDEDADRSEANGTLSEINESTLSPTIIKVKREFCRKSIIDDSLTKFIVKHRIPLKAIHSSEFISLVKVLSPDYHLPSQETITNILIPRELKLL